MQLMKIKVEKKKRPTKKELRELREMVVAIQNDPVTMKQIREKILAPSSG